MRVLLLLAVGIWAAPVSAQVFRSPLECSNCIGLWHYFDNDPRPSQSVRDWNCASATYDGHRGSDFAINGSNGAIDDGYNVVAVSRGVVVSTQDGHFDRCRSCSGSGCGIDFGGGFGNHVVINHGDHRVIYAHLRMGSVRVGVGDSVDCGDVIAQVGSSGCSTGAHLHFETRSLGGAPASAFDPFGGTCSPGASLWNSQGAHRGLPGQECDGTPVAPTCPAGTYEIWTCNAERTSRRRCIDGIDTIEECPGGCQSMPVGTDDTCAPAPAVDADEDGSPAGEDCDDSDPRRRPGMMETCGDGVDQDCDGSDLACPGTDAGPPPPTRDASAGPDARPLNDAGPRPDVRRDVGAGSDGDGPPLTAGCACRAFGATRSPYGLGALALGLLLRRRRRRLRSERESR